MRRIMAVGVVGALLWGEYENWRASREFVRDVPARHEVVVVLGSRNRGRRANALNRWRVRAGLRSRDPRATRSCLVLSGGAVGSAVSEAALMAEYAAARGRTDDVVLETTSRSTWQNIEQVVPLVEHFDRIKIVSNPLHARKARMYLARQRPDLAERVARSSEYRFGEWMPAKVAFAVYGRVKGGSVMGGTRRGWQESHFPATDRRESGFPATTGQRPVLDRHGEFSAGQRIVMGLISGERRYWTRPS